MIARCPHCDTAFRIVADQLRVRDGRVRCGVCHQVFDGRAALERATREAAAAPPWSDQAGGKAAGAAVGATPDGKLAPPVGPPPAAINLANAPKPAVAANRPSPPELPAAPIAARRPEPMLSGSRAGAPLASENRAPADPEFFDPPEPTISSGRAEPRLGGEPAAGISARAEPVLRPAPGGTDSPSLTAGGTRPGAAPRLSGLSGPANPAAARVAPTYRPAPEAAETPAARQFVASRPDAPLPPVLAANGQNGVMRLLWSLGFWIALLALLGQAIWWWRNPLATYFPPLRTPLEAVCQSLGCEVGYLRAPHKLAIVSSSVQPDVLGATDEVQHLRLQAVLRNRAEHAQPWPTLEIILTDHGDAMVARRAVSPTEYLPNAMQRQPFGAGAQQEVQLVLAARGTPVSGYRLNLFFP